MCGCKGSKATQRNAGVPSSDATNAAGTVFCVVGKNADDEEKDFLHAWQEEKIQYAQAALARLTRRRAAMTALKETTMVIIEVQTPISDNQ